MKKLLLIPVLMFVLFCGNALAQSKIAVVDLGKAVNDTKAGLKASEEMKAYYTQAQTKANKLASEMDNIQKDVETQRSVLSQDAIQKKMADIQKKRVEIERLQKDTQDELQNKQNILLQPIMEGMVKIISDYGKEKKLDLVVEARAGAVYFDPTIDITAEIVKRYDAKWKQK